MAILGISYMLWFDLSEGVWKIFPQTITSSINDLVSYVFVEQPRLYQVC